jgi:hypothetical protein
VSAPAAPPIRQGGRAWRTWALIAGGAVLRFADLGRQSFWHDEVHSVIMARGGDSGSLAETVFNTHGPLYLLILRGWMHLFGAGEAATRALSALIGVLGLIVFARVIRRFVGPGARDVALALLAVSPFHLGYSQEVRGYGLLFAIGLLAVEACLADLERRTPATFAAALLATLATCLSNLSGFFLIGLVGVFAWVVGRPLGYRMRRYAGFVLLVGILLEPWIVGGAESTGKFSVGTPPAHSDVILAKGESPPGLMSIPYSLYDFTFGRSLGPNVDDLKLHRMAALVPHLPYLVPALALVILLLVLGWRRARGASGTLIAVWLVLPVLAMALVSTVNLKAANSRYAFLAFPPFLLLVALGIESIGHRAWRRTALGLVLVLFMWADEQYFVNPTYWKPDARAAGALLAREARATDAVVVYALDFPVRFYTPESIGFLTPRVDSLGTEAAMADWIHEHVRPDQRLWIVQCNAWWMDRDDRFLHVCDRLRPRERTWRFVKLPVYRFGPEAGS